MQEDAADAIQDAPPTTEVDLEFTPVPPSNRGRVLAMALGALALVAAIVGGVIVAAGDDATEVTAASDDTPAEVEEPEDDEPVEDAATDATEDASTDEAIEQPDDVDYAEEDAMMEAADSMYYGGGGVDVGQLRYVDGRGFVGIGHGFDGGLVLHESPDGETWTQTPIDGLPANASMWQIAEEDGLWVGLVEEYPEYEEFEDGSPEMYFGPYPQPARSVASSTNLIDWTLTPLPDISVESEEFYIATIALADGQVVLAGESYPTGPNEMQILFEAGLIDTDQLEQFCGTDVAGDDEPIVVYACAYDDTIDLKMMALEEQMANAETDEEREALEAEMEAFWADFEEPEPEILLEIPPSNPVHAEILGIWEGQDEWNPTTILLTGAPTGPFSVTEVDGLAMHSITATDSGWVGIGHDFESDTPGQTFRVSTDGVNWTTGGSIDGWVDTLLHFEGSLFGVANDHDGQGGVDIVRSDDGGRTWTATPLSVDLYGGHGWGVSGPAGMAIMVEGSAEPMPVYEPEPISLVKDGYTLTINYSNEWGLMTLTDASGAQIHQVSEEEVYSGRQPGVEGVVEFGGRWDSEMTFLNPETGEGLVTFTDEDWEQAYSETEAADAVIDFEEPDWVSTLLFSADGTTWVEVDADVGHTMHSSTQLMGVGDDEILIVKHTYNEMEPPEDLFAFEMEGREPTEEELEALYAWESEANGTEWVRLPIPG